VVGSSIYHVGLQAGRWNQNQELQLLTQAMATGTAIRRLSDEHRLPETSPRPTFTLGLDN